MVLTSVIKCRIYIWGFFSPHPECDTAKTCHWRTTTRHRCENDRRDTPCGQALLGVPLGSRVKLLCPAGASLLEALHGPKGFTDAPPTHTVSSQTLQTPFSLNPCDWGSKAQDQELVLGFWCSRCAGLSGCPMASPLRSRLPLPHTPQKENNPAPGGDCGNFMSSLGGRKRDEFYFTALPFLLEQGKSLFFSVL